MQTTAARIPRRFRTWLDRERSRQTGGYRWFQLWIGVGLALALLLLVNSISSYVMVSRRLVVERLRGELASQAATMEQQVRQGTVRDSAQLAGLLRQAQESGSRRAGWIQVRDGDGAVVSTAGAAPAPAFSIQEIRSRMAARQPIFKTLDDGAGGLLVAVFPFRLPGPAAAENPARTKAGRTPRQFGSIEIGASLEGGSATLWPLRRNLTINSSAALALLISLTAIALRLRAYVGGRQLEREVEVARSVQRDLLPSPARKPDHFEFAADCVPAARVSGDFFDTFAGRGGRPAFVLGDVSGKGVPAALLMGVIHGAVRSSSWTDSPAQHAEASRQINRLLCERAATERFATMFWSYFDSDSQHLKYINAGHCPPLLLKAADPGRALRLTTGGPVLGLLPDAEYQKGSVLLAAGDILVLYSDGIVEAANADGEEFGEERVQSIVSRRRNSAAAEIRDEILSAVETFSGRTVPEDDRTLCVVVYSGMATRFGGRESDAGRELAASVA